MKTRLICIKLVIHAVGLDEERESKEASRI